MFLFRLNVKWRKTSYGNMAENKPELETVNKWHQPQSGRRDLE